MLFSFWAIALVWFPPFDYFFEGANCCRGMLLSRFSIRHISPRYELGIWSMIVPHLLEVCIILTSRVLLARESNRRDKLQGVHEGESEGLKMDMERERD
jgi:hypothetical protein